MSFSKYPRAITPIIGLLVLGLSGCEQKKTGVDAMPVVETSAAEACGVAPSGDFVAERIMSANPTHTEPGLYEGPVWINGALYFSDFTFGPGFPSRIQKLDASGIVSTAIDDSGSNGLAVDAHGNIIAATHKYKSLSRYNISTGERTSVVEQYNHNVFNSPNDLTIAKDGTIYFTDPDYQREAAPGGQDKTAVYRLATDGTVAVIDDTFKNPNGISLSPAGDILYVNGNTESGQGVVRAYPIVNGVPQPGKDFVTVDGADGMTVDCLGNLYVTEHLAERMRVFTPAGEHIATIKVDAKITNGAFGGANGKTLFLTGAGSLWKLNLQVSGSPY